MSFTMRSTVIAVLIGCTPAPPPGGQSAAMTLEEATSWTSNARRDSFPASSPFQSSTAPFAIGDAERSRGWLWNTSCPVAWEQLEVLTVRYKGFDGKGHTGRLLVKRGAAAQLAPVFKRLYQDGFRFEQVDYMITLAVIQYPHLASNNTYSFQCRQTISGGSWSAHAYGTGIDINLDRLKQIGLGSPQPAYSLTEEKVRFAYETEVFYSMLDSAELCQFVYGPTWTLYDGKDTAHMVSSVTGWDMTVEELMEVGRRRLDLFRVFNARFDDEAGVVTRHGAVHLGMATQTDAGLMVPVIRNAQSMNVWQLASEIVRLAEAARSGKAKSEELSGSTLTVTSLGPLGGIATTPVINRPEVAIIGPNRVIERPVIRNGEIVAAKLMNLSISCDHRVVDGWDAASYVQAVRKLLETPVLLFAD